MKKPLHFYVIDEHEDTIKYCQAKRLVPSKFGTSRCKIDDTEIKYATQYVKDGYVYDILGYNECYTNSDALILMRLPKLSYIELLDLAINSRHLEERIGSTGIILKDYSEEFEATLISMNDSRVTALGGKRHIKRMVKYAYWIIDESSYMEQFGNIKNLCKGLLSLLKSY